MVSLTSTFMKNSISIRLPSIFAALLPGLLVGVSSSTASGKDYDMPELNAALSLSSIWVPVSQALVQVYNDDMIRRRPQTRTRFVAGFTHGAPNDGTDTGSDYVWIQKTPMPDPPFTPEQFATMLPRVTSKNKSQFEGLLKDKVASIDPGIAHYEARLNAVIYDSSPTLPDGSSGRMRAFLIMTKKCLISINAYSTPASADAVFEEVRGVVSTLNIKEDQKMPPTWIGRLQAILTQ